jgi:tetratricopeptide (TPR) repeat protein
MTRLHVFSSCIAGLTLALSPLPALASPSALGSALLAPSQDADTQAEARASYETGKTAYRLGRFEDAAVAFERAYELSGLSDILYNIGLAHLRWYDVDLDLAHLRQARAVFQNYILELQKNPELGDMAEAESVIAQIEEKIAAHQADEGVGTVGDDDIEDPAPKPIEIGPDPSKKLRLGGGIAMGLGGALIVGGAVGGVIMGLRGQAIEDDINLEYDARDTAGCSQGDTGQACMEIEARITDLTAQGRAANAVALGVGVSLGAVGVIGVVVGAVLFVKGREKSKSWKQGQLGVTPIWSPGGGGVAVLGRF